MAIKVLIAVAAVLALGQFADAQQPQKIAKLKDLCIDTVLVANGKPQAVLVAPAGERYADAVRTIQGAVKRCGGTELPVLRDAANPEDVLKRHNVIVLGNMVTNPFVEHMYRQWYVLLDLKYPGRGGHVVRSLHSPYGTGRNVIWIGGSDDEGVSVAAKVFANLLKPGGPLKVGWLMEIQLGRGMTPPKIGDDVPGWRVYSWRDSWRQVEGKKTGYSPSTFFGWNPISIAGVLYYMTGQKEYLDYFKAMAMPDPKRIPIPNRTDDAFNDPMNPLVKNYHYRAHLVDCVFDMVEESPLFTDEERLFITNKLLEHQNFYDPKDNYPRPNTSRHGMWHMLNIYTGSRYFAKYYPSARWEKRVENVRKAFRGWIGNPTWGELDTLGWVSTSTEPVFEFFMLDGFDEFVQSGTARTMVSALEILWSGRQFEESNRSLTINLLHKAAYMLKDGRYVWLARKLGFDFDAFRIGQSFWPPDKVAVEPPTDLVGRISHYPLPRTYWRWTGESIPLEEGFQVLSWRAGLTAKDDFFQIDGFYGRGRNPYHVNPLYVLRINGQALLSGYGSQVSVRRNGMVEPKVAMAAALKQAAALGSVAYVKTRVPDMPFSTWKRHVLHMGGMYAVVLDEITARDAGIFEIAWGWDMLGAPSQDRQLSRRVTTTAGGGLCCAQPTSMTIAGRTVRQTWTGELKKDERVSVANLLFPKRGGGRPSRIDPVGQSASLIRGEAAALVVAGDFKSNALAFRGELAHLSADGIFLARATELRCGDRVVARCDEPVSVMWDLKSGALSVEAQSQCRLRLDAEIRQLDVKPDQRELGKVAPDPGVTAAVAAALQDFANQAQEATPGVVKTEEVELSWEPKWRAKVEGNVTHLAVAAHSRPRTLWVVTADRKPKPGGRLSLLSLEGTVLKTTDYDSRPLSLWPAADETQAEAFAALVGFRDDKFRAFAANGQEIWQETAAIHPKFKIGDRYSAPWFSDPRPGRDHRGVYSIFAGDLWGKGKQEIAIGRPCTVEFRGFNGKLIERVATHWGDNTSVAMLRQAGMDRGKPRPRWLLAAKMRTGHPGVSVIGQDYRCASDGYYRANERGTTSMNAWMQRGVSHLAVVDLDNDGVEEVVVVLSGHWNQLNVYRGGSGACLWSRCFGPARSRSRFMSSLIVADLTDDGRKEIVVGMVNGWVCAFDCAGTPIWQKRFPSGIASMCAVGRPARLAVACQNGELLLIDSKGHTLRAAKLDARVSSVIAHGHSISAGTDAGTVARFGTRF